MILISDDATALVVLRDEPDDSQLSLRISEGLSDNFQGTLHPFPESRYYEMEMRCELV